MDHEPMCPLYLSKFIYDSMVYCTLSFLQIHGSCAVVPHLQPERIAALSKFNTASYLALIQENLKHELLSLDLKEVLSYNSKF